MNFGIRHPIRRHAEFGTVGQSRSSEFDANWRRMEERDEAPDRQPWRDRGPDHPRRVARWASTPSRSTPRSIGARRTSSWPTQAYPIGPAPAPESYLDIDRLLAAAIRSGADLLHPGYGFLAENADFAERVEAAGLTWVGPPPAAMRLMGSKTESRKLAVDAGVPLIPGLMEPITEISRARGLCRRARAAGAAQGGGRWRRQGNAGGARSRRARERPSSARAPRGRPISATIGSMSNDWSTRARHIEVQVAADRDGNAVYVGERECSIQRRHQKVVEECPSPVVGPDLRRRLGEAALAIVRASGYHSVGTVEFLLDPRRQFLLPRDEHPAPGRAPGHRGGLRRRSGAASRSNSPSAISCRCARRTWCPAATPSSAGSTPRIRCGTSHRRPVGSRSGAPGRARGAGRFRRYGRERRSARLRPHARQAGGVGARSPGCGRAAAAGAVRVSGPRDRHHPDSVPRVWSR